MVRYMKLIILLVKLTIKNRVITATGKRGSLTKDFRKIKVELKQTKNSKGKNVVEINSYLTTYKQSAIVNTRKSHIRSMMQGVSVGFRYKMLAAKKHFPITVEAKDGQVFVKNFIGSKENIVVNVLPGVTAIKNEKNPDGELWFEGNDKQTVSQMCSLVNQACDVGEKDKRKFLDGVYLSERGLIA